jgi:hypothetical protein
MAVGGGLYVPAVFATVLLLASLQVLGSFEHRFDLKPTPMKFEVFGSAADQMIAEINGLLGGEHLHMQNVEISTADGMFRVRFVLPESRADSKLLAEKMTSLPSIRRVKFIGSRAPERE